jgi:hypothetical protein
MKANEVPALTPEQGATHEAITALKTPMSSAGIDDDVAYKHIVELCNCVKDGERASQWTRSAVREVKLSVAGLDSSLSISSSSSCRDVDPTWCLTHCLS